jgi:hypothetical protein
MTHLILIIISSVYSIINNKDFIFLQDNSFDFQNYHAYNGWAFIENRYFLDLNAADPLHTYINPIPDAIFFLMAISLPGIIVNILILIIQFSAAYPLIKIFEHLSQFKNSKVDAIFKIFILIAAFGSAINAPLLGSQINDLTMGSLLVWLFWFTLRGFLANKKNLIPFFLMGTIFSFKFSNAYAVFFIFSFYFIIMLGRKLNLKNYIYFVASFCTGFILLWLTWLPTLMKATGNPFFPLMTNYFGPKNYSFTSDLGQNNLGEILYFLTRGANKSTELNFFDLRFIVVFGLLILFLTTISLERVLKIKNFQNKTINLSIELIALLISLLATMSIWVIVGGYQRYLSFISLMLPIIISLVIYNISSRVKYLQGQKKSKVIQVFVIILLLSIFEITTSYNTWGRIDSRDKIIFENEYSTELKSNDALILPGPPNSIFAVMYRQSGAIYADFPSLWLPYPISKTEKNNLIEKYQNWYNGKVLKILIPDRYFPQDIFYKDIYVYIDKIIDNCSLINNKFIGTSKICTLIDAEINMDQVYNTNSNNMSNVAFLGRGWFPAEEWGTWAKDDSSNISVPIPFDCRYRPCILEIGMKSFDSRMNSMRYEIQNIQYDNVIQLDQNNDFKFQIGIGPESIQGTTMEINIVDYNKTSPKSLGISEDERKLGIGIEYFKFIEE